MAATAQQILDALNDALLVFWQKGGVQSYTNGDVTITRVNVGEITKQRDRLQAEIAGASTAAGGAVNLAKRGSE